MELLAIALADITTVQNIYSTQVFVTANTKAIANSSV